MYDICKIFNSSNKECIKLDKFDVTYRLPGSVLWGARCSSMVRAFAHGAMGCQINPS